MPIAFAVQSSTGTSRIIPCAKPVHQVADSGAVDIPACKKPGPRGPGFWWFCRGARGSASGDGSEAGAHQPDAVEIGLFPGAFLGALAGLIALVQELDFLEFVECLTQQALGVLELDPQFVGGAGQVFPALDRRLGVGR